MLGYIAIAVIASVFFYIGNHEYHEKGWLLAVISVILSFVTLAVLPFGLLAMFATNLVFFFALMIYNIATKKPPGSQSGF